MGRRKIAIEPIEDPRLRQISFEKRKIGLLKKAIELSVLCQCEVICLVKHRDRYIQYGSDSIERQIHDYQAFEGDVEDIHNSDVLVVIENSN